MREQLATPVPTARGQGPGNVHKPHGTPGEASTRAPRGTSPVTLATEGGLPGGLGRAGPVLAWIWGAVGEPSGVLPLGLAFGEGVGVQVAMLRAG